MSVWDQVNEQGGEWILIKDLTYDITVMFKM